MMGKNSNGSQLVIYVLRKTLYWYFQSFATAGRHKASVTCNKKEGKMMTHNVNIILTVLALHTACIGIKYDNPIDSPQCSGSTIKFNALYFGKNLSLQNRYFKIDKTASLCCISPCHCSLQASKIWSIQTTALAGMPDIMLQRVPSKWPE